nr:hypothetical protein OG999_20695 [Streptomyces sp. NBC_00886]
MIKRFVGGCAVGEREQRLTRWRRPAALVVLAAVLLAGAAWRLIDLHNAKPRLVVVSSRSSVLGTWKMEDGHTGQVEFAANGRFSAVGLPVDTSQGGEFTGAGSWSLDDRGGSVILTPDHVPSGMGPDAGLAVVRADGRVQLCVTSGSPGVLCDYLLRLAAAPGASAKLLDVRFMIM